MLAETGGGGSAGCSMTSILNDTCGMTVSVLYTAKINKDSVINSITTLKQDIDVNQTAAENLITDINGVLKSTNSQRFSTGEVAVSKINTMNDITDDITKLLEVLANIDIGKIGCEVDRYNFKLVNLKRKTRKHFARESAEKLKGKVLEGPSSRVATVGSYDTWNPTDNYSRRDSKTVIHRYGYSLIEETVDGRSYSYSETIEVDINCSAFNIYELENVITEYGGSLPYNPAAIVDYED